MKNLISKIIEETGQKYISFDYEGFDFIFSYYDNKDDFHLFLFSDYKDLISPMNNINDIEFSLNDLVRSVQAKKLEKYAERYLDLNLSCVVVLKHMDDDDLLPFKKAEENYMITKKYILSYSENSKIKLSEELSKNNLNSIVQSLNELAVINSDCLNNSINNDWYILLLRLFIKIPFLNYETGSDEKESLVDVKELFMSSLDNQSTDLYNKIIRNYQSTIDVEEFLRKIDYLEDE
ncbi:hypothetical protein [Marixanthomonas spongiae]|nr:hypothetical protein [Marixanthomonas spongiae]